MGQFAKPGNPQAYVFDPNSTIANGDLVMWDSTNHVVARLTASSDYLSFIGVAEFQNPQSSPLDTSQVVLGQSYMGLVRRAGIFPMLTTNGETYRHGDQLKWAGNGQVALTTGGTELIAFVNRPDGTPLTGAAGVSVDVEIYARAGSPVILSA